jgi:hypothetical protein
MKFLILEKVYFAKYKGKQYIFYVNPTANDLSAENESKYNRAIIDKNGDLYVEARIFHEEEYERSSELMHVDMMDILHKLNPSLFSTDNTYYMAFDKRFLSELICLNRVGNTNRFEPSEIYEIVIPPNTPLIKKAKKKNPTLKFIL